jgi:hypothetical protein
VAADPVAEAVQRLKAAREDAYARIRAIDDALLALEGVQAVSRPLDGGPKQTLKDRVLALLNEQDIEWSAPMVTEELRLQNFNGLNGSDPSSGVRTSLNRLAKAGKIRRTSYGYYKAAKWFIVPKGLATPRPVNEITLATLREAFPHAEIDPDPYANWEPDGDDLQHMRERELEHRDEVLAADFDPGGEPF